ncbi:MAG: hypothetical protein ACI4M3_06760 [Acutalibacteraceae bacterium]
MEIFKKYEKPSGKITAVGYSQNHMCYTYCFSFHIAEKNGEYLFSADCCVKTEDYERVNFKDKAVTADDMQCLIDILQKHDTQTFLMKYKAPKQLFFACDQTTVSFSVRWENGVHLGARAVGNAEDEIEKFFFDLALKYKS